MENKNNEMTLIEMMEKNLKLSEEIHINSVKIRKYMLVRTIISIIWIVIIVAPIIFAVIWLPSHFNDFMEGYGLGGNSDTLKMLNRLN